MGKSPMAAMIVLARILVRAHAFQQPFRTVLTVTGVALGVLASVAITAANVEVLRAFEQAVLTVAGPATLEVSAHDLGLDETVIDVIRGTPGVAKASPLIEEAFILEGPHGAESVQVYGVDLLGEVDQLGFRLEGVGNEEALNDLLKRHSVYVGRQLSTEWSLRRGSRVQARAGSRVLRLSVAGVVEGTDRPGSYWNRVVVMDVAAAQVVFDMLGRLDRIQIVTAPERRVDEVAMALRAALPASVVVQRPGQRTLQVENMVGAFQLNLAVLSWVGLLVGMFLVYNTMNFSVAQRRREIGIYRAIGMTERRVAAVFLLEAIVFGVLGGALGACAGLWLARSLVRLVGRTISDLYVPLTSSGAVAAFDAQNVAFVAQGILVGVVVSMAGAVGPSRDASHTVTTKALAPGDYEQTEIVRSRRYVRGSLLLLLVGGLCVLGPPIRGLPILGYAATLCLLGAFACLSPVCLAAWRWSLRQRRHVSPVLSGNLKRMAADHAARHPGRNAVTVSALLIGLAIMIGVVVMVRSFRHTVEAWVDQTVMADLIIAPPAWLHGKQAGHASRTLPNSWLAAVSAIEGVAAVDTYRDVQVEAEGQLAALVSRDLRLHAERGRYLMIDDDWATVVRRAAETGGVVVSEVLANRLGLRVGGTVTVTTPAGPHTFPVEGVFYDYATDGGKMVMERTVYRRFWNDDRVTVFAVYLDPGADHERVKRLVAQALASREPSLAPPLMISNADLRREILDIFDRTFVLTYVLEAIAVFVAVLGIVNTLVTAVLERGRELATLRAIGASRSQVEQLVQWEAAYLGVLGAVLGVMAGLALAWVLIAVINKQSFGWTIHMTIPIEVLVQAVVLSIGAAWIAGYLPARWAARQPVGEGLREE